MTSIFKTLATLAVASAATVGVPAFAAVQTVDAVGYTFSFDDGVWGTAAGTSFSSAGNVFTFSNLGYDSASSVARRGNASSYLYDELYSAITITAKAGYSLTSVVTGATGLVSAMAGADASAYASAYAYGGTYWSTNLSGYKPYGWLSTSTYVNAGDADVRAYSATETATFGAGETTAVGSYIAQLGTYSFAGGSSARATLDTASFAVAVSAVPEPETYAMLLAGLGLVGAVARRRRPATL